ncbi:hypothetical protein AVEN_109467-1 [Araneus ventricosus]|uniref:Uncharacterized protein n=1 Tax=Araneus ventricosus TaxID=182803 RepID=A0A4Y2SUK5_ARAVE|nr:hypothetical protein AVEN_109467-1 [Araneus ventricosus]
MAIQAGKSLTSCPQLVSVPLTGLERMLSSSLNMAYLKRFHLSDSDYCSCGGIGTACTSLCHGVYLYSVLAYEEASAKLRTRMAEKGRQ